MKARTAFILLATLVVVLFGMNLLWGSVHIPANEVANALLGNADANPTYSYIVLQSRIPQAITALLTGAALAVSGLLLQTAFHNPLAGPSILGITTGANLGVALVMLGLGGTIAGSSFAISGYLAVVLGAFVGSLLIMGILLVLSTILKNNLMLLITGILISYLASSAIALLNLSATKEGLHGFTLWGMGDFGGVSLSQLPFFCIVTLVGIVLSVCLIKPLNALQLGENYAGNLGVNLTRTRNVLLLTTGILTAITTAFCGPVSFIGLAVPHMARLLTKSDNHQILLPATLLSGAIVALLCNLLCTLPESSVIPLNAVTPLIGAPVILYIILKNSR